jgi:hypothetical protein
LEQGVKSGVNGVSHRRKAVDTLGVHHGMVFEVRNAVGECFPPTYSGFSEK